MRLIPRTVTIAAVVIAALWTQTPPAGAGNVPPGRIVSLIPSDDEVSQYVGLPVRRYLDAPDPKPLAPVRTDERNECRSLHYADTADVWGSDYAAFRRQYWTDPGDPNRIIMGQSVGTFLDAGAARERFDAVYNNNLFNACSHAPLHGPGMDPGVTSELYDFKTNDDVMVWTMAVRYNGEYTGFNTVFVAFHLANVMSISSIGQNGNPNQAVQRLTDYILNRVG